MRSVESGFEASSGSNEGSQFACFATCSNSPRCQRRTELKSEPGAYLFSLLELLKSLLSFLGKNASQNHEVSLDRGREHDAVRQISASIVTGICFRLIVAHGDKK